MAHAHAAGPVGLWPLTLMWLGMMAAMMAPTVWPWVRAFHRFAGRSGTSSIAAITHSTAVAAAPSTSVATAFSNLAVTAQFAAGYLVAWLAYSVAAALAQLALQRGGALDPAAGSVAPRIGAALFVVAGLYQLAPLKRACLTHCRSPFSYFLTRWRNGPAGGFRMGLHHGLYCVGCCWALMATTLAVGVMSVWWMVVLAAIALGEQVAPSGHTLRRPLGVALLAAGVWRL